jgi:hypothetical protein
MLVVFGKVIELMLCSLDVRSWSSARGTECFVDFRGLVDSIGSD